MPIKRSAFDAYSLDDARKNVKKFLYEQGSEEIIKGSFTPADLSND